MCEYIHTYRQTDRQTNRQTDMSSYLFLLPCLYGLQPSEAKIIITCFLFCFLLVIMFCFWGNIPAVLNLTVTTYLGALITISQGSLNTTRKQEIITL